MRHKVRALVARRCRCKWTAVMKMKLRKMAKPYPHKVWILFKGQQEATEKFAQGRVIVRFTFLEVPL